MRVGRASLGLLALSTLACGSSDPDPLLSEVGLVEDQNQGPSEHDQTQHDRTSDDVDQRDDARSSEEGATSGGPGGTSASSTDPAEREELEAILDALEQHYADAVASRLTAGEVTEEVEAAITAAFAPQLGQAILEALATDDPELAAFQPPDRLGPRVHTVIEVLERTPSCIHLESLVDDRALVADGASDGRSFVILEPASTPVDEGDEVDWVIARLPAGDADELRTTPRC